MSKLYVNGILDLWILEESGVPGTAFHSKEQSRADHFPALSIFDLCIYKSLLKKKKRFGK